MQDVDRDVKERLEAFRRARESFKGSPKKARQWLIRMGVLDKTGKRLARRYR